MILIVTHSSVSKTYQYFTKLHKSYIKDYNVFNLYTLYYISGISPFTLYCPSWKFWILLHPCHWEQCKFIENVNLATLFKYKLDTLVAWYFLGWLSVSLGHSRVRRPLSTGHRWVTITPVWMAVTERGRVVMHFRMLLGNYCMKCVLVLIPPPKYNTNIIILLPLLCYMNYLVTFIV